MDHHQGLRRNLHFLLDMGGNSDKDEETKALNALSASVKLVYPVYPWYIPELEDRDREQDKGPITKKELVSDLLHHCNTNEFMGPEQIHPRVRELLEELINPISSIYQQSWIIKEIPGDWRLVSVTTHYKKNQEDLGNYSPFSLTLMSGNVMEQIILDAITHHIQDNQTSGPPGVGL